MNETIFATKATHKNAAYDISFYSVDSPVVEKAMSGQFGTLIYSAVWQEESYEIIFSFDVVHDKIDFSLNVLPSMKTSCLLVCGLGSLVGQVMDCYVKSKDKKTGKVDWAKFKACLAAQGHTLGASTVACIIGCP